jgi:hypothetical protein
MKLTMVSVRVKGVTFTGFVVVPTEYKDSKIRLTHDEIKSVTGAPIRPNSCFEVA